MPRRFFSPDSFWNQPIAPNAATDPGSAEFIAALQRGKGGTPLHINTDRYTIPVFSVDASTPRRTVHQATVAFEGGDRHLRDAYYALHPAFGRNVPIPAAAAPDPASDAHLALLDWENNRAYDMWAARRRDDGDYEASTGTDYPLDGPGIFRTEDFPIQDFESIHYHGPSRAAGVPIIAGLIMEDEIRAGRIEHKLAFASWNNARCRFVFPACWTDGFCDFGLPEGATLQLDPAFNLDALDLSPGGRAVATALQEYGMVNVDCAVGNVLYAELLTVHGRSWEGLLASGELGQLPLEAFRVLELGPVVERGDDPRKFFAAKGLAYNADA